MSHWPKYRDTIYLILDRQGQPRYVGHSINSLDTRFRKHRSARTPVGDWLRSDGHGATIVGVAEFEEGKAGAFERQIIRTLRSSGASLLNIWPRVEHHG